MIQLDVNRHAADRVARLRAEAEARRVAPHATGQVAKVAAALLRNWASRLDRPSVGGGTIQTADLVSLDRLGHRA